MRAKRTRTMVTVGMTIGIASIVFLVSIGYGLQALVISRVARLDEMKQIDVTVHAGVSLAKRRISCYLPWNSGCRTSTAADCRSRQGEIQQSATDMAVYGVTHDYLEQSAVKRLSAGF